MLKIKELVAKDNILQIKRATHAKALESGIAKNERIDEQLSQANFDLESRNRLLPKETPQSIRALTQGIRYTIEGTAVGGGAGTLFPVIGNIFGAVAGGIGGAIAGGIGGAAYGGYKGFMHVDPEKTEAAIRQELVDYLCSQKVDVAKHEAEIRAISEQIMELTKNKELQDKIDSELKVARIRNAYVTRTLLRSAAQNTHLLSESCELNGMESLDAFVNSFKGEMGIALKRFCFGLANTNDMTLIIAEANALSGAHLKPHERVLKDFVETIVKPDIGSFLSSASKVDVISQSNLLPYGAPLDWTRGIIRDENDAGLAALLSNEFGNSVVGVQDVKHIFDFYLHRHGDKQLYDAKLKDGQMDNEYPSKRINVIPKEDMERFVDMTKQSMSHGRKTLPEVSDMFLRVCAYEYFRPQAVRTAKTDNVFAENPEAPAAYPMVNATVNAFIEKMSLGPIKKYREVVGERLDNVIAQTFIDYFLTLGARHAENNKIDAHRRQLRNSANSDGYGPVFSAYMRRITMDSENQYQLFLEIYRENLEKHFQVLTEADRKQLEEHLASLPDPSKGILTPEIMKPGSHRAKLLATYEDHTLENLSKKTNTGGQERL